MVAASQPRPLPVPDNFRFEWDSPEEAAAFWSVDLMHWPNGVSPLAATMDAPAFFRGLKQAADELSMPFRNVRFKVIHNYGYMSTEPWSLDPQEMQNRLNETRARMMQHIPGLLDRWRTEYEPEVRAINDETLNGDYSKLSDRDLSALFEKLVDKREREGLLHFLAVFPAMGAVLAYEEMYTHLFGPPQAGEHLQLLQGFPNKSVETGVALWHLAQEARKRPQVLETLRRVSPAAADSALDTSEEGRVFRDAVKEYRSKYGWRAAELDIAEPTWTEQPAPIYRLVREYAARDDYNPEDEFKSLVTAREAREKLLLDKHAAVERWLIRHPRFHLHVTPTSASWLNLVERFFSELTQKRIRRGVFKTVKELVAAIYHYLDQRNQHPKPFIWTASVHTILEKVRRGNEALDALH